jgi:putative transferase (TIGR04331 family)
LRLALTSIDALSEEEREETVYLGEWVVVYPNTTEQLGSNVRICRYHWDDRAKLQSDYRYLSELFQRAIPALGMQLNKVLGVNHAPVYWEILIGPWLHEFIQVLFDRFCSLEVASKEYQKLKVNLFSLNLDKMTPNDMPDFRSTINSNLWNHYIYGEIIKRTEFPIEWLEVEAPSENDSFLEFRERQNAHRADRGVFRVASTIQSFAEFLERRFRRQTDVFIFQSYLPTTLRLSIYLRLWQFPIVSSKQEIKVYQVSSNLRNWQVPLEPQNKFERLFVDILTNQIPKIYVEGYSDLCKAVNQKNWPSNPRAIFTANGYNSHDHFKEWVGRKKEGGVPLLIAQHGGTNGIGLIVSAEDRERAISDRYLTWGWSETDNLQLVPIGQVKHKRKRRRFFRKYKSLVLVTFGKSPFSASISSFPVSGQWSQYQNENYQFVDSLQLSVRDQLIVRLYPIEYGWNQRDRWRNRFSKVQVDDTVGHLDALLKECRLVVCTYNSTTFLETMTMGIPTVIVWNPKFSELRSGSVGDFERLRKVRVFFDNPAEAANHVNQIWENVLGWWLDVEVQAEVAKFCKKYSYLNSRWAEDFSKLIKQVEQSSDNNRLMRKL